MKICQSIRYSKACMRLIKICYQHQNFRFCLSYKIQHQNSNRTEFLKKHGEHKKFSTELLNNTSVRDLREPRTNTETIKVMKFRFWKFRNRTFTNRKFRNWKFRHQNQTFNRKLSTGINVDTVMNKLSSMRVVGARQ